MTVKRTGRRFGLAGGLAFVAWDLCTLDFMGAQEGIRDMLRERRERKAARETATKGA
ncbi:hypothetical protein ACN20G_34070 (plasmid) [Streptomyces sp. BI20]|uniref:hypothetical protein n=1 Tax=Streptomyces sp. BI20 TaxID=3403460 RepID=UPI003C71325C